MAVVDNTVSEIGDIILIKGDVPLIGLVDITGFSDTLVGVTGSRLFKKEFRHSIDGLNFSTFIELTVPNLTSISVNPLGFFFIEYRYTRIGTDTSGVLEFVDNTLTADFQEIVCGPNYEESIFNQFFSCFDPAISAWCLNVLDKLYKPGIVPRYITRGVNNNENGEDEDYIAFWKSVACFFAIIVTYARVFENFSTNSQILSEYLLQKGLFICKGEEELIDMQFLMREYYSSIAERGTTNIIKKKVDLRQIRTHTLTGTFGTANIIINGTNYLATFTSDLSTSASNFVITHANDILGVEQVTVTSSGDDIILTSSIAGGTFTTASVNVLGNLASTIVSTQEVNHIEVNGEILRIVCFRPECDEFLFALTDIQKFGWNIGNSSPLYKGTNFIDQLIKGYENTQSALDLTKYPLNESSFVTTEDDSSGTEIEFIKNGVFSSGSNWTIVGGSAIAIAGGVLELVQAVSVFGEITQSINLPGGSIYIFQYDTVLDLGSGDAVLELRGIGIPSKTFTLSDVIATNKLEIDLSNDGNTYTTLAFHASDVSAGTGFHFDNMSLKESLFKDGELKVITIDAVDAAKISGISPNLASIPATDFEKALIIDNVLDYEITCLIKQEDVTEDIISFGAFAFDKANNQVNLFNAFDTNTSTFFFTEKSLNQDETYYLLRGIIYGSSESVKSASDSILNIGLGNHLRMGTDAVKIIPYLVLDNTNGGGASSKIYIADFKVRPLRTEYSTGFIQSNNFIQIWTKNNNVDLSKSTINDTIEEFLIPFNSRLKVKFL